MTQYGRNKFSCVMDPTAEASHDLLLRLAAKCHVVLQDDADDAMKTLDYGALRAVRNDIVLAVIGEGRERPGLGNVAAGAVMTALFHVRFRGEGQEVRVGFPAAVASMSSAPIVAAASGSEQLTPDLPPSGCYACTDGSIAVVVRSIEDLAALGEVVGHPELVDAVTGGEELSEELAEWTSTRAAHAAAIELRDHGVPAQRVLTAAELREDPHMIARGVFEPVATGSGVVETEGPRVRFSRTPLHTRFPLPAAGEHNAYVLRDLIGMTDEEIAAL
jgi:crotonobetainyl-CoA:carnitine CoA-transferase CaiB-like acyl-CoA transferase